MKHFIQTSRSWIRAHKIWSAAIIILIAGTTYAGVRAVNGGDTETRYVLGSVKRGTLVASVTGTGQVSASDQVDLTAKASGDLVSLNAKAGQAVANGALIGRIDAGDAAYELETARLSYEKLVTVDPDDLRDAETAVTDARDDLSDAYVDTRATLTTASTDMTDVLGGVEDLFGGYLSTTNNFSGGKTARGYIERAEKAYYDADDLSDEFLKKYRMLSVSTSREDTEALIDESQHVAVAAAQTAKYAEDATAYLRKQEDKDSAAADEAYATATALVSKANAVVTNLSSAQASLEAAKRTLDEAERDLADLKAGPDALDVRASQLSVRQKEEALDDYSLRAPFAGILASVDAKKGQHVNSGTTIATLITTQKIAEVSLNEIDAARIAVGQKATLTLDALDDLTIEGEVAEVDLVGTVSQGVVNYTVKIAFDTDDERVKPGMTVNATIITDTKENVLLVPTSAIKSQGDRSYVEVVTDGAPLENTKGALAGIMLTAPPARANVVTGLSNDESTEIVSGLEEGQRYVARTITAAAQSSAQTSAPSLFGGNGARSAGGAAAGRGAFFRQ